MNAVLPRPDIDMAEPMSPLHIFFGLRGRIPRKIFWLYGVVVPLALSGYGHALLAIAGVANAGPGSQALEGALDFVVLWSAMAVSAKRWHDLDKSGWWALLQLVPVVGQVVTLVGNGLMRGTCGPNRFGSDLTGKL